ncbi:hypothetical protein GPECTOR_2g1426 [Gonium pectorale]|uniref:Uncharacterized protein n=1 Tax=Gonium pectorale TaxID=33097 RepID=A0A150H1C6_GONPE|nr:hypothetical protein GPECTOR_2g1426 [Gonium pectorale]|eukprot:KXZ55875.1 hypothetical protein GPECTOR_2g1426 [Gonium pectorale]
MDEMRDELQRLMAEEALRDVAVLVIANKQALKAHLDWLVSTLRHKRKLQPASQHPAPPAAPAATADAAQADTRAGDGRGGGGSGSEPDILERWLQAEDEPDDEFLRKLEDYSLELWDHRTHLRLAWLYLTRHGRRDGLARIHASIRAFIANSPVTRRKTGTTYHETMTYFWAHMVHFAIASLKVPDGATVDFKLFLLMNPQLSNGGLFLHYYSKQLMLQTPEARTCVVLPDKRPLPSILTDLSALSFKEVPKLPAAGAGAARGPASQLSDAEFLSRFLSRSLDRWNHECLLRAIYCCLSRHGRRRGGNVALDALRALQGDGFHLTINYFWVNTVTHTLANEYSQALFADRPPPAQATGELAEGSTAAAGEVAGGDREHGEWALGPMLLPEWPVLLASKGYTAVRMQELVADPERFLRHYSKGVAYSDAAAAQFVPPDKRPLPSTV